MTTIASMDMREPYSNSLLQMPRLLPNVPAHHPLNPLHLFPQLTRCSLSPLPFPLSNLTSSPQRPQLWLRGKSLHHILQFMPLYTCYSHPQGTCRIPAKMILPIGFPSSVSPKRRGFVVASQTSKISLTRRITLHFILRVGTIERRSVRVPVCDSGRRILSNSKSIVQHCL